MDITPVLKELDRSISIKTENLHKLVALVGMAERGDVCTATALRVAIEYLKLNIEELEKIRFLLISTSTKTH